MSITTQRENEYPRKKYGTIVKDSLITNDLVGSCYKVWNVKKRRTYRMIKTTKNDGKKMVLTPEEE